MGEGPGVRAGRAAVFLPFFLLFLLLTACDTPPRRVIRLGSLIQVTKADPVRLPAGEATAGEPYRAEPGLNAARVARLRLKARGSAGMATLAWKLAGDRGFLPYRTLSFQVAADGAEHAYEVDLQREPYWTGRVEVLRLGVDQGKLEVLELTGEPASGPYRSMSLKGESLPSLPGLGKIEVRLPDGLPRGAALEAYLGLVPEYDRLGVRAAFRIWWERDGRREQWLEEAVDGSAGVAGTGGWRFVRKEIPAGAGRLSLEVAATRNGEPLPEGVALWGAPLIVTPGKKVGKNLIVILVDTVRADVMGAWGSREGLTPNLDRMAAQGIRFDHMLAPAPWTLPSVASLMTGLQPQTHGAGIRYGTFAPTGLTRGERTMAEALADAGLFTFGVYHNIYVNPAFGLQQGFDEYDAYEERSDVLVDHALAGLRRIAPDRRFFLYLHLFDPHNPYEPPEKECREVARRFAPEYHGTLGCAVDRRPEMPIPPEGDRRWYEALYHAEIAHTDAQIGRLLAGLHDLGLDDDTVVAMVSDHGEEFWTRLDREQEWGYDANSDHGHTLYQELLHVPAIVRVPGRAPAVVRGPVQMVDLFPTLLHLAGAEAPPSQGRDLVPLFDGGPPAQPTLLADVVLHGEIHRWSIQRGPWKLIVPREAGPPVELYDLDHDPGETRNLAASQPVIAASLRGLGERELAQRQKDRARFIAGDDSLGATYLEWNHITKLRSLGYLR